MSEQATAQSRFEEAFLADLRAAFDFGWESAEWSARMPSHNSADVRARRMDDNFLLLLDNRSFTVRASERPKGER